MAALQLEIEGEGSVPATEALLAIDGLEGSYTTEGEASKEAVLATIATIVGITGGTITIAEKLYAWYQHYRQQPSAQKLDKVLLLGRNGEKIVLADATVEQIKKILES